jgi:hypothetical protein
MTQSKQMTDETRWVSAMAEMLGLELLDGPKSQDPPRPDVVLTLIDGRRIAVEVTEAMDEATRKGYDGARELIVRLVTEGMKERGLAATVHLSIPLGFLPVLGGLPGKAQRELSSRIIELAGEALAMPLKTGTRGSVFADDPEDRPRRPNLQFVGDLRSRAISYFRWITVSPSSDVRVSTGTGGTGSGQSVIQEAIDRKAEKRGRYDLSGIHELWLLVVGSTGTGGSLDIHVAERNTFSSPFAQTFFLECWEEKCIRLTTMPLPVHPDPR